MFNDRVGRSSITFFGFCHLYKFFLFSSSLGNYLNRAISVFPLWNREGAFQADCEALAVHEHIEKDKVQVRTFQGTIKQTLPFLEGEGEPVAMDINGNFLVVASVTGVIKVWDLSRR